MQEQEQVPYPGSACGAVSAAAVAGAPGPCEGRALLWDCPSLFELEAVLAATPARRAAGEDRIPSSAVRAAPGAIARLLHPLVCKVMGAGREPVSWQGGMIQELWKGKGSPLDMASYRAILLSSHLAKAYYRTLRARLSVSLVQFASQLQCGGLAGRGTDLAALGLRAALSAARIALRSVGLLYVDVRTAFYTVIRSTVFGGRGAAMPHWDDALQVLGVGLREDSSLLGLFQREAAMGCARVSPGVVRAVAAAHDRTWFSTQHLDDVVVYDTGSMPGTPLGDAVFTFASAKAHREIREVLLAEDICLHLAALPVAGPLWPAAPPPPPAPRPLRARRGARAASPTLSMLTTRCTLSTPTSRPGSSRPSPAPRLWSTVSTLGMACRSILIVARLSACCSLRAGVPALSAVALRRTCMSASRMWPPAAAPAMSASLGPTSTSAVLWLKGGCARTSTSSASPPRTARLATSAVASLPSPVLNVIPSLLLCRALCSPGCFQRGFLV